MPIFTYNGIDGTGKFVTGEENGETPAEVVNRLSAVGISVTSIQPKDKGSFTLDLMKFFRWVSAYELKFFYVNLATLIDAGCSLRASLASLADQADNYTLKQVLTDINAQIASGKSFSEALKAHPEIFTPLFTSLVKAGEEGGMLDQILLRYAAYTENQEKTKSRVRSALVLPALISVVAVGVVIGLLTYVFPTFMQLFQGKEDKLPLPTKMVMAVSDFMRYQWPQLLGLIFTAIVAFWLFLRTRIGWRIWSWIELHLPLFGTLFRKIYVGRFAHTLGALIKGGVPALRALRIAGDTIPNDYVRDVINQIHSSVERGGSFTGPMHLNKHLFPSMVALMIHVGETTGKIDLMLQKVGDYFDAEVQETISAILTAIEPILTVIMGVIVLTIALSMFLPLFNITQLMK
ncbi:MAG: Type IV fimbrial assembly protein PilC [Candidatus Ozemobacter sibiricus]|uniref:Type IV fimbrial assembly protein PilC n=1 Tax=Candidatus Ozemobacter sibiricus TaxID=2268124 RepID=A0A367ZPL9_9BACT|nr:MAG: Type IV fimbrial assembly protein PilC [Candidatus Ozemobacter sibiricus]